MNTGFDATMNQLYVMLIIGRNVRYNSNTHYKSSVYRKHIAYFFTTLHRNLLSQIKGSLVI